MRAIVRPVLACLPALVLACATGTQPPAAEPGAAPRVEAAVTLCSGPGVSYGIPDFPCPAATVQGWVGNGPGSGPRTRTHAWYLFAGLHQPTSGGQPLWRTWPTSTQVFPDQFGPQRVGGMHEQLLPLPGALLERPVPGTPRFAGSDVTVDQGVDARDLALPGAPHYEVPSEILGDKRYASCLRKNSKGQPFLIDGPTFQSNGDVMVAGVIYSPRAADSILRARLWDAAVLDGGLPPSPTAIANATMPNDSVVLKPQLWPVRGDGFTPLPRWNVANTPDADKIVVRSGGLSTECEIYSGFERQELWKEAVALSAFNPFNVLPATADATYLETVGLVESFDLRCQPTDIRKLGVTYRNLPVVPLSRFYTFKYTKAQLDAMNACDRALLDQSALWSYNRRYEAQDALVLIAMHIMTKEQPGWTFQSAWWDLAARDCGGSSTNDCRYAGNRPASIGSDEVWKNYFMTTTYGMTQQPTGSHQNRWPPGSTATNHWPVAFNPYIELAAGHPIETNCINCHRRAAWPSRITPSRRFPDRNSAYLVTGVNVPGLIDSFQLNNPVLGGLLTLDSMWAISDRAYYPPAQAEGSEE